MFKKLDTITFVALCGLLLFILTADTLATWKKSSKVTGASAEFPFWCDCRWRDGSAIYQGWGSLVASPEGMWIIAAPEATYGISNMSECVFRHTLSATQVPMPAPVLPQMEELKPGKAEKH